jgi:hypothetical protein
MQILRSAPRRFAGGCSLCLLLAAQASAQAVQSSDLATTGIAAGVAQDQNTDQSTKTKSLLRQIVPLISIGYEWYLPSSGLARSIFGDSTGSFTLSLRDFESSPGKRVYFGFATDSFSIGGSSNKLFVFTPEAAFEYRIPIAQHFSAFAGLSGGPSYMDYSFDNPAGAHFGAKRLGAEGEVKIGLRYTRLQLEASYHALTEPAGISFNGLQLAVTYIVVRF